MPKFNSLKVWPDISGYIPAIIPFVINDSRGKDVNIHFNNCAIVDSTGINLLLLNILNKIVNTKNVTGWTCKSKLENENIEFIKKIGFFKLLTKLGKSPDFFWRDMEEIVDIPIETIGIFGEKRISFPIYLLQFKKNENRRNALLPFKTRLYGLLEEFGDIYNFSFAHFIAILTEIAKNSADHTDTPCLFGLDIFKSYSGQFLRITFSIGDLGIGINENTKDHLPLNERARYNYWDLTQTYRKALQTGFTSKPNSFENRGIGMSIIINGAKNIGIKLLVFDAKSSGLISDINVDKLSHNEIRKSFYFLDRKVGFYYYGELNLERKNA